MLTFPGSHHLYVMRLISGSHNLKVKTGRGLQGHIIPHLLSHAWCYKYPDNMQRYEMCRSLTDTDTALQRWRYVARIFLLRCLEFIGYSICVSFWGRSGWIDCSLTTSFSVILGDCYQSRYTHVMSFALVWGFGVSSLSPCRKVWKRFMVNPVHYQFPLMC